jgi:hypothetical protein
MEQQHKIAQSVFNIAFADHGQMLERSGMLAGLVHDRLAPRISDVFDACDTGPEVVRIDRLEVDLGTVAYNDLEAALTKRLGQALQSALQTRSTITSTDATVTARRLSAQQNHLDLITHYLSTGRLPWWAERRSQADVTRTLSDLIDNAHRELTAYLRQQSAKDNPVLSRLVRQFEPGLVRRLIARLAPSSVQTIELDMKALLAHHAARAILPLQGHELAWAIRETLLRRLLAPAVAHRSTDTLVAEALQKVAASHQLHPARLLRNLKTSNMRLDIAAQSTDLEGAIGNLLSCLERQTGGQSTPQPRHTPKKALTPPFPSESSHGNPLTYPEPDEDNLPTPPPLPEAEQALARHLSQQQFHDLFEVLEPDHAEFMAALVDHFERFQPAVPGTSIGPALVSSRFREIILTYLLEERTTRFSPEHCCACTIHRLAVHCDVAYTELLNRIRASIAGPTVIEEKTRRQLLAVLDSLHAQTGRSATRPPHGRDAPPLSQSDSLLNRLRYILQGAPLSEEDSLDSVASDTGPAALTQDIPVSLQDLLDRLGPEQVLAFRRWLKRLPAAGRAKLVERLRQGAKRPETRPAKGSLDTTKINPSDDWAALLATLTEEKPGVGRSNEGMAGTPGHLSAPDDQKGVTSNYPTTPPPRLFEPSPHDATTALVASTPSQKTGGPHVRPESGNAEARHGQESYGFNHVQGTRFETNPSIYVQNAGMVLAAPFLPRLFGMLGLLEEKRFKGRLTAERAVHLLEFMVNERHAAPEFQLVLNKILCGLDGPVPIADGFDPTEQEIEAVHRMLEGMIGHWKIVGNTSVAGLRSSFLQRQGYLTFENDDWHLQVEGRSFDMLLDQLPWSIAVIKHSWMTRVLHVNWR